MPLALNTNQNNMAETKALLDEIKAFCCNEMPEEEWRALTTPNKSLVLASRRFFNWVSIVYVSNDDVRQRKSKRSSSPNYKKYQDHAKPTVDNMINSWNASGLSQAE